MTMPPGPRPARGASQARAAAATQGAAGRKVRKSKWDKAEKNRQEEASGVRRKQLYIGGGVAGMLLLVGLVMWLVPRPGRMWVAAGGGGGGAKAEDVGPITVAAAQADVAGLSAADLLASAVPPDNWVVALDGVDPVDGPRQLFTAFNNPEAVLQFAAPGTGHAALLGSWNNQRRWVRYDLRKPPQPIGEALLPYASYGPPYSFLGGGGHSILDLSPDGQWLAGALGTLFVSLWETTGQQVGRFYPGTENMKGQNLRVNPSGYTWVGFTDANHLAMLTSNKKLEIRDVPSGAIASATAVEIEAPAVLSPGRKWLVGCAVDGFRWLSLPDWKHVGTLRLPGKMPAERVPPAIAISADGARFAAYFPLPKAQMLLTWDVRTGALRDAVVLQEVYGPHNPWMQFRVQWTGPRTVLLNGTSLVDLDLGAQVYMGWSLHVRGAPDDRVWQLGPGGLNDADGNKRRERLLEAVTGMGGLAAAPMWESPTAFFASRLPYPALTERLDALRGQPMLFRTRPVRVEVAGGPDKFRRTAAVELASFLRSKGYVTDPKAPVAVRLVMHRPTTQKRIMQAPGRLTFNVRGGVATPSGPETTFAVVKGSLTVIDRDGQVVWTAPVGDGVAAIAPETASEPDLDAADPAALAKAREEFFRQFLSGSAKNALRPVEVVAFDHGKPIYLPLQGRGLPLEGVLDGGLAEPGR
jgi:hypothetical protein